MTERHQLLADLADLRQRIADAEGYLQRMNALVERMQAKDQNSTDQELVIAEIHATLQSFEENRDQLQRVLNQTE